LKTFERKNVWGEYFTASCGRGSDLRWIDSEIARFKGHIGLKS